MLVGLCDACDSPVAGTVRFLRLAPVGVGCDACDDWGRLGCYDCCSACVPWLPAASCSVFCSAFCSAGLSVLFCDCASFAALRSRFAISLISRLSCFSASFVALSLSKRSSGLASMRLKPCQARFTMCAAICSLLSLRWSAPILAGIYGHADEHLRIVWHAPWPADAGV